jgi:peroxiredoxin
MRSTLLLSTLFVSFAAFQNGGETKSPREVKEPKAEKPVRLKAGDAAPEFTVKNLEGKDVTLASLRGEEKDKIVVISFWSHSCPWSRAWDAELSKIAKDYASKNVVVVAIDSNKEGNGDGTNKDTAEDIQRYHKENSLNFNVYTDSTSAVANAFGGQTTPDVFVIGTDGKIHYTGQVNDMADPGKPAKFEKNYLRDALDALQRGKEPETTTTSPRGCSIKRAKAAPKQ